jgi:hypothetical protein
MQRPRWILFLYDLGDIIILKQTDGLKLLNFIMRKGDSVVVQAPPLLRRVQSVLIVIGQSIIVYICFQQSYD